MLRIKGATLRLSGRVLFHDLSLTVKPGEWLCVTGESGCGKTSLLRAVLGFLPLDAGSIFISGKQLSPHTVAFIRKQTAYVPQELFLPAESVEEMLLLPFNLKVNKARCLSKEKLFDLWDKLGLQPNLLQRKVTQLSGGQRQRIILSMEALLGKPLMIVDEPTSALDDESVTKVAALFRSLSQDGTALLSVSHNRYFLSACDNVLRL